MKSILVPTDFSEPANNATHYAAELARISGAKLTLFHVFKLSIHASNALANTGTIDKLMAQHKSELNKIASDLHSKYGIAVDFEIRQNDTIENLKEYTSDHRVDLVVMGIQNNLPEYKWFGNTTTSAIQLMQFPLLVVPDSSKFKGIKKITYACDAQYIKENCELTTLRNIVKINAARLDVLHVLNKENETEPDQQMEEKLKPLLKNLDYQFHYVRNKNIQQGILDGTTENHADLLVMVHHRMGFFESLIKNSNSGTMTVSTTLPLLVISNEQLC